jgi:hypothetical protein
MATIGQLVVDESIAEGEERGVGGASLPALKSDLPIGAEST